MGFLNAAELASLSCASRENALANAAVFNKIESFESADGGASQVSSMKQVCGNCGKAMEPTAKFCSACGSRLASASPLPRVHPTPSPQPPSVPPLPLSTGKAPPPPPMPTHARILSSARAPPGSPRREREIEAQFAELLARERADREAVERPVFDLFMENEIPFQIFRHPAVPTVEASKALRGNIPGVHLKNLVLRNKKKTAFFLFSSAEDRDIDLKALASQLGSLAVGGLSFVRLDQMTELLGVGKVGERRRVFYSLTCSLTYSLTSLL